MMIVYTDQNPYKFVILKSRSCPLGLIVVLVVYVYFVLSFEVYYGGLTKMSRPVST